MSIRVEFDGIGSHGRGRCATVRGALGGERPDVRRGVRVEKWHSLYIAQKFRAQWVSRLSLSHGFHQIKNPRSGLKPDDWRNVPEIRSLSHHSCNTVRSHPNDCRHVSFLPSSCSLPIPWGSVQLTRLMYYTFFYLKFSIFSQPLFQPLTKRKRRNRAGLGALSFLPENISSSKVVKEVVRGKFRLHWTKIHCGGKYGRNQVLRKCVQR